MSIMRSYNATVEVAKRGIPPESALEHLEPYSAALSKSERGRQEAVLTLTADSMRQAAVTALAVVEQALGSPAVSVEVMPTDEYDRRLDLADVPELVGVTEAADLLGVSRQAVLDRIGRGTLPAVKVGREYVIRRAAVA